MSERLKFVGRLTEEKLKNKKLRLRANGLVRSLRDLLDPFVDPVQIDGEQVSALAFDLAACLADLAESDRKVAAIAKALGR